MKRSFREVVRAYRSEMLLATLVAAMLASPLLDVHPRVGGVVALLQLTLLFVGARYLANQKILRRVIFPTGMLWLCSRLLEAFAGPNHAYSHLSPVAGLLLSTAILWGFMRRFSSIQNVTSSIISEAIICYLLLAVAFSQLYWVLDHFLPNAFNQRISYSQSGTFLYFSMISLTGVGYGDILPINSYVRLVAAFENVVGLFYLAVVIARLVSSYRTTPAQPDLPTPRRIQPPE